MGDHKKCYFIPDGNRNPCLGNKTKGKIKYSNYGNAPYWDDQIKVEKTHHLCNRKTHHHIEFENNLKKKKSLLQNN